jgi:hypothetical protein
MKNLFHLGKISKGLPSVMFFFAMFFLGTTDVSAQNYLGSTEATAKLKNQTLVLAENLNSVKMGSAAYNVTYATYNYYNAIVEYLTTGSNVAGAIEKADRGICYPTDLTDCTELSKSEKATVISDTKAFLTL